MDPYSSPYINPIIVVSIFFSSGAFGGQWPGKVFALVALWLFLHCLVGPICTLPLGEKPSPFGLVSFTS